jgi:hypothetical protein
MCNQANEGSCISPCVAGSSCNAPPLHWVPPPAGSFTFAHLLCCLMHRILAAKVRDALPGHTLWADFFVFCGFCCAAGGRVWAVDAAASQSGSPSTQSAQCGVWFVTLHPHAFAGLATACLSVPTCLSSLGSCFGLSLSLYFKPIKCAADDAEGFASACRPGSAEHRVAGQFSGSLRCYAPLKTNQV